MFLRHNWPGLIWALFILIICGIPGTDLPRLSFLDWLSPDKITHLAVYAFLSFLLIRGFTAQSTFEFLHQSPKVWAVLLSILYGGLIEILQDQVFIDRTGDLRDAIANGIGAVIGLWIYKKYLHRKKKLSNGDYAD